MKLATLKGQQRDGSLAVVNRELTKAMVVPVIAPTLQVALDNWQQTEPQLENPAFMVPCPRTKPGLQGHVWPVFYPLLRHGQKR